jgi:hypothetical protein
MERGTPRFETVLEVLVNVTAVRLLPEHPTGFRRNESADDQQGEQQQHAVKELPAQEVNRQCDQHRIGYHRSGKSLIHLRP